MGENSTCIGKINMQIDISNKDGHPMFLVETFYQDFFFSKMVRHHDAVMEEARFRF
jgi:hypothetical protein